MAERNARIKKGSRTLVIAIAFLAITTPLYGQGAQDFLDLVQADAASWYDSLKPVGGFLLMTLFALETWITYGSMQLEGAGVQRFAGEMLRKLIVVGIVAMIFWYPNLFLFRILNAFRGAGAVLTGGVAYTPGQIAAQGVLLTDELAIAWFQLMTEMIAVLFDFTNAGGTGIAVAIAMFISFVGYIPALLKYLLASGLVALAAVMLAWIIFNIVFLLVSAMVIYVELQAIFIIATGPFFAGFSGFRVTAGMTENYLRYVVETGIRLFLIQYMVSLGARLTSNIWMPAISGAVIPVTDPMNIFGFPILNTATLLGVIGAVVMYGFLTWSIPGQFARRFSGDLAIGIRSAMGGR
jgi:P-type conjugative transfer protein TrbL